MLPIVAFLGSSGAGKSTLMRLLIKTGPKPLPGSPLCNTPTSSDIHAYLSSLSDHGGPDSVLFCDCEGKHGAVPISSKFKHLYMMNNKELENLRSEYVNIAFPRLMYMFSDVVVLVTNGSRRAIKELTDEISIFGGLAASGTVNQLRLPALIVVYNKRAFREGMWDVEQASKELQIPTEFNSFFRSVTVVGILFQLYIFYI